MFQLMFAICQSSSTETTLLFIFYLCSLTLVVYKTNHRVTEMIFKRLQILFPQNFQLVKELFFIIEELTR